MPSETWEVRFDDIAYGGAAVGRLPAGRAVFVPFALPGERARIELVQSKERYARGRLVELLESSPKRMTARCGHFGACGGCQFQHIEYAQQLKVKSGILRDQLVRIGRIADPPVAETVGSPNPWNYRNQVQFHLNPQGRIGYIRAPGDGGSGEILAIEECHLPDGPISTVWPQLFFESGTDIERVVIRSATDEQVMLVLEAHEPEVPDIRIESSISVAHVYDQDLVIHTGTGHLEMSVLDRAFTVSPTTFFQVNIPVAERMVKHVLAQIPHDCGVIIDAYCGAGLFSAFLAPLCRTLIGIEDSPPAGDDFAANLDEFDNVDLYLDTAEHVLPTLELHPDVVLVDPPRAGLRPPALDALIRLQPRLLIYVSCDPSTLARDAGRLVGEGYRLESATPFDMFPQTYHIESVSIFRR